MATFAPTKAGLIFGWSCFLAALACAACLNYPANFAALSFFGFLGQLFLGARQMEPLQEQIEANPGFWSFVVFPYYMCLCVVLLFCAFAHKTVIYFFTDSGVGMVAFFIMLFWPFTPSLLRHERERYQRAR